ncbi:hypothetical protein ACFQ2B_30685 [Streptomyces stramineus]
MNGTARIACVDCLPELPGTAPDGRLSLARFGEITVDRTRPDTFERYLHELGEDDVLAAVFVGGGAFAAPDAVRKLRGHKKFAKTRAYVVGEGSGGRVPGWAETLDVEDILAPSAFEGYGFADRAEIGMRAYHSLVQDENYTDYYLDMTYNKIFDWFETTRWDWKELDLDHMRPEMLDAEEIDFLTEAAIIEFGTLPGAHNFLREWEGRPASPPGR